VNLLSTVAEEYSIDQKDENGATSFASTLQTRVKDSHSFATSS